MNSKKSLIERISDCLGTDGQPLKAEWAALLPETKAGERRFPAAVRESITGNSCLLLRSAVAARNTSQPSDLSSLITDSEEASFFVPGKKVGRTNLQSLCEALREFAEDNCSDDLLLQLQSRITLLKAIASDDKKSPEQVQTDIYNAVHWCIQTYDTTWNWKTTSYADELQAESTGPAFLRNLSAKYSSPLRKLAVDEGFGWMHPGLLIAAETIAMVEGHASQPDATTKTWVLFAGEDKDDYHGVIAKLTMERLRHGSGLLVPSAASCGYLLMGRQLSEALQNAWYVVRKKYKGVQAFDWRWSLDLVHASRNLPDKPAQVPLDGRSPEAAFACAMLALHPQHKGSFDGMDPLDPHVAVTAMFANPGSGSTKLKAVTSVDIKTLAKDMPRKRVFDVVVAEGHKKNDLPNDTNFHFPEAPTLEDAWEQLSRWTRITRTVKRGIHHQALELLDKLCGPQPADPEEDGHRYVQSPLRQIFPHLRESNNTVESLRESEPHHDLDSSELAAFANGTWRPWQAPINRRSSR